MCARSNASSAADSSCVGGLGAGGGVEVGLTALAAATFCVFLTLGLTFPTATFLAAAFRVAGLVAAFLALVVDLVLEAAFLAGRALAGRRTAAFATGARFAFCFADDLAFTARFAVFAADGFALERDADRLKPFVRLLLICGISKGCSPDREQPLESPEAYHTWTFKSTETSICGSFKALNPLTVSVNVQNKKNT